MTIHSHFSSSASLVGGNTRRCTEATRPESLPRGPSALGKFFCAHSLFISHFTNIMMYSIPLNKQEVNSSGYEGRLAVEKPPVSFAQRIKGTYHEYAKVLYLAFCFGLLFIGYSVSLSFLTALYPGTTGFIVIFIIFGTSAVTSFAVP